jgi:3-phenylpropionate/cinnamic acid dioxygenase small subunit
MVGDDSGPTGVDAPREELERLVTERRARQFLFEEADLLDSFRLERWVDYLSEDVTITVPVRTDRDASAEKPTFSDSSYYVKMDYDGVRERVNRLQKEYAWAENPRSRLRHCVGNVRVSRVDGDELKVLNNQLVFRSRGDTEAYELVSAERTSTLRDDGDGLRLADRVVRLDHTILPTRNLTLPML